MVLCFLVIPGYYYDIVFGIVLPNNYYVTPAASRRQRAAAVCRVGQDTTVCVCMYW